MSRNSKPSGDHPREELDATAAERYLDVAYDVGRLKRLARSGWVQARVANPESVAEHSFRTAILTLLLLPHLGKSLDPDVLIRMALIHDLAEALTGDIIVQQGSQKDTTQHEEKEREERRALERLLRGVEGAESVLTLFTDLTARRSPEARLVWELDRLEMGIQALEYEEEQDLDLDEFFATVKAAIHAPFLRLLFATVMARRERK